MRDMKKATLADGFLPMQSGSGPDSSLRLARSYCKSRRTLATSVKTLPDCWKSDPVRRASTV